MYKLVKLRTLQNGTGGDKNCFVAEKLEKSPRMHFAELCVPGGQTGPSPQN